MGFFTWTFANRKLRTTKYGDYKACCKLPYDGYGCVLCPDGTVIEEPCYNGYGIFGGKDVYELVVDWNKEHLTAMMEGKYDTENIYYNLAAEYMHNGTKAAQAYIDKIVAEGKANKYMPTDWKRNLGIELSCNTNVVFPIKIVSTPRPRLSYDKLPASIHCQ